jgi:hypothetical protein
MVCARQIPKVCFTEFNALFRINTKLLSSELEPMTDLVKDLSDGVKLIQLLVRTHPARGLWVVKLISLIL